MSLSQYNLRSQLTTNVRRLALKVVLNLDTDRSDWVSDVVVKIALVGPHDTLRDCWIPVGFETLLEITGDEKNQINSSSTSKGKTSSSSSMIGGRCRKETNQFVLYLKG